MKHSGRKLAEPTSCMQTGLREGLQHKPAVQERHVKDVEYILNTNSVLNLFFAKGTGAGGNCVRDSLAASSNNLKAPAPNCRRVV